MKKKYTPEDIKAAVTSLDTRAKTLPPESIDSIIDDGYAELCTITQPFSNEEVINLASYYETGEEKLTLDIQEDVVAIYDLYLTKENQDKDIYEYGIKKIRDRKVIYKDNRYNGRVHIDLEIAPKDLDNAVLKYYYVPTHTTSAVYMDSQTWIALKSALGVALYDHMHDVERNGQKRAEMVRRAKAIIPSDPEDYAEPIVGHIFAGLTH